MSRTGRRRLLAVVGAAAGSSFVAGCLAEPRGSGEDDPTRADSRPPGGAFPTECPEYRRVERVVCYDQIDPDEVDGYLEPSTRVVGIDDSIEFTLHNRSRRTLRTNFYDWNVRKYVDGEWYHVAPLSHPSPATSLPPGGEHAWTVTIENAGIEAGESVAGVSRMEEVTLRGVGGGYYAFRGRGDFEGDGQPGAIAFAATFEFDGAPLELTPTTAVAETEWEGDTLVARSTRGDPDGDYARLGALVLERVENPDERPKRLLPEHAVRHDQLRDALALAYENDATRIRLVEYTPTSPIFRFRSSAVYEFRDAYYEVTTHEVSAGDE